MKGKKVLITKAIMDKYGKEKKASKLNWIDFLRTKEKN